MKDDLLLREIELFRNLTPEQISKVSDILHPVKFPENEIIMREGDAGDSMYIIMEGTVEVVKSLIISDMDEEDREKSKVFTRLDAKHHAVFGEIALLEKQKRTATVKALTNCLVYKIKRDDFLRLAEKDHELGYRMLLNLARIISARLRKADEDTIKLTTALCMILKES
ncbi:MAG: cyclic nucleotide-binding domain-containing protein [Syntrophales bacterium]|nr:cyclic nucleotide-binding domain-containing protein [Syntrophales bacterium]